MSKGRPSKTPGTHVYFAGEWAPLAKQLASALNNKPDWTEAKVALIEFQIKILQKF